MLNYQTSELDSVQKILLSRIEVSLYRDVTSQTPMRSVCLEEVANWVKGNDKNGQFLRRQTEEIRRLKAEGKVDEAGKLKKRMPAITSNAIYQVSRRKEAPHEETGLIFFDFDHLTAEEIDMVREKVKTTPYVVMAKVSISGEGMHLFCRLPEKGKFEDLFSLAWKRMEEDFAFVAEKMDKACKDKTRLAFLNYDPNVYTNWEAQPMPLQSPAEVKVLKHLKPAMDRVQVARFVESLGEWFNKYHANENKASTASPVAALAGMCNSHGYPETESANECWRVYGESCGVEEKKFREVFNYVYRRYAGQFGTKKNTSPTEEGYRATEATIKIEDEIVLPLLPHDMYDRLPPFFKDVLSLEHFKPHEADVVVLSLLPVCGAALSATLVYEDKYAYPAIYSVIVGKPASGKGVAAGVQFVSRAWEDRVRKIAAQEKKSYTHRAAANITLAKLIEQMRDNERLPLLITDSEMLGMATANNNRETGGTDYVLNTSYEYETTCRSTKVGGNIEVRNPKLQLLLTGTRGQFFSTFRSNENGLSSRLLAYSMPPQVDYKPLSFVEDQDPEKEEKKNALQQRYAAIANKQFLLTEPMVWALTRKQTDKLNKQMITLQECMCTPDLPWSESTIIRARAKVIRIASVLSGIRFFDDMQNVKTSVRKKKVYFVFDDDFKVACDIMLTSLEHTLTLQSMLHVKECRPAMKSCPDWRDTFYTQQLPDSFRYTQGLDLCKAFGKKTATWKKALHHWETQGKLRKREDGVWEKVKPSADTDAKA